MSDRTDAEFRRFMQEYLNYNEYQKLLVNPIYNEEFEKFLENEYEKLYTCPCCYSKSVTPYKYCARCLTDFGVSEDIFAFVECGWCKEEMVICDAANIENNNNIMLGLCMNCGEDTMVYKCPECNDFTNLEVHDNTDCHPGFCKWN